MITKYLLSFFAVASNVLCNKDAPQLQERRKKNIFSVYFFSASSSSFYLTSRSHIQCCCTEKSMKSMLVMLLENVCGNMQGSKEKCLARYFVASHV